MTEKELLDIMREHEAGHAERIEKANLRIDELAAKISKPRLPDVGGEGGSGDTMRAIAKAITENRGDMEKFGSLRFEVPGSLSKSVYSTNNAAPFPVAGILDGARAGAPFRLRQMLPAVRVNSGSAWRIVETGLTSNVAQRAAEGDASNSTTINIAGETVQMVSFSHYATLSEEAMADIEQLMQYLERTLAFGLSSKIDAYLLDKIRTNALTYNANALGTFQPTNAVERLVVGAGQLEAAGYTPSVAIQNTAFLRSMGMMKASGSGEYMFGSPTLGVAQSVSDMALIGSSSQAVDNWTVLDAGRCIVYERGSAMVELGRINDDFAKHLVRLRVSERLACAKVADGVAVNGAHS